MPYTQDSRGAQPTAAISDLSDQAVAPSRTRGRDFVLIWDTGSHVHQEEDSHGNALTAGKTFRRYQEGGSAAATYASRNTLKRQTVRPAQPVRAASCTLRPARDKEDIERKSDGAGPFWMQRSANDGQGIQYIRTCRYASRRQLPPGSYFRVPLFAFVPTLYYKNSLYTSYSSLSQATIAQRLPIALAAVAFDLGDVFTIPR